MCFREGTPFAFIFINLLICYQDSKKFIYVWKNCKKAISTSADITTKTLYKN